MAAEKMGRQAKVVKHNNFTARGEGDTGPQEGDEIAVLVV